MKKEKRYHYSKLFLWVLFLCFAVTSVNAQQAQQALETFLKSPSLDKNQTVIYILDLEADRQIVAYQADKPVTPASVMKCISTAELRAAHPYASRLKTEVKLDGTTKNSVFTGNIIIIGSGDPSLGDGRHKDQKDFPTEIANALKKKGIMSVEGNIKIDDSLFAGPAQHPSWGAGDLNAYYGTGVHAFNFEGNASGKTAVKNPGAVFKRKLIDAMSKSGIAFKENAEVSGTGKPSLLLSYQSPKVSELAQSCMFRSDNLYAETFLRLFGLKYGSNGSVIDSAKKAMQYWDGLNFNVDAIEIVDGSGLSRQNKLTAEFLGSVLKSLKNDPHYTSFFPLVGEEGTVRNFLKDTPLQGYMALKTGSMNGIQSYAGYVLDEDFYPTHVVVVMTNNLKNRENYRKALAQFFLTLFKK